MARKPGKLAAAASVAKTAEPTAAANEDAGIENTTTETPKTPGKKRGRGDRHIGGYFSEETLKQLKILGAIEGKTQQALLQEALNGLFEKYGKPPIA